ncbi:hypothetical protein FBU59_006783 [Linderina macrospora]|uniref:Uncharacterized protein n=1 Tax=Linderina macrospora TaxID=4868 RepID=A0ACC1IYX5_9FUNG|nr:hypothetical protein FBU59_006783 [Linderina macrospora]
MEIVSPAMLLAAYLSPTMFGLVPAQSLQTSFSGNLFVLLWIAHYINRAILYPVRAPSRKPLPLDTVIEAVIFNSINGYLSGRYFSVINPDQYTHGYFADHPVRCLVGLGLFAMGMYGNIYHDGILMELRNSGVTREYAVPTGGLFEWVSCPHYFSEVVEWLGLALATGSPAVLTFALNTMANLFSRAVFVHRWYRTQFANYPKNRKAVIPFLF